MASPARKCGVKYLCVFLLHLLRKSLTLERIPRCVLGPDVFGPSFPPKHHCAVVAAVIGASFMESCMDGSLLVSGPDVNNMLTVQC